MVSYKEIEICKPDGSKKTFDELVEGKSIAVVGNAQSLFNKKYGKEIDAHDLVIRFNKFAPLYSDYDVTATHGNRVDIWAFWTVGAFINKCLSEPNTERLSDAFYNDNIVKVQMTKSHHIEDTRKYIEFTYSNLRFNQLKQSVNKYSRFLKRSKVRNSIKNSEYQCSAGLIMLNWLFECNPKLVDIYGMDFKTTPTFSEIDRYKSDVRYRIDQRCKHNFELEEIYAKKVILKYSKFRLKG